MDLQQSAAAGTARAADRSRPPRCRRRCRPASWPAAGSRTSSARSARTRRSPGLPHGRSAPPGPRSGDRTLVYAADHGRGDPLSGFRPRAPARTRWGRCRRSSFPARRRPVPPLGFPEAGQAGLRAPARRCGRRWRDRAARSHRWPARRPSLRPAPPGVAAVAAIDLGGQDSSGPRPSAAAGRAARPPPAARPAPAAPPDRAGRATGSARCRRAARERRCPRDGPRRLSSASSAALTSADRSSG